MEAKRVVLEGDPARQIVDYAHEEKVDLIVMPTHGYGPFRQFILGSITAKVLHDADCPVWTGVHLEEAPQVTEPHRSGISCARSIWVRRAATRWSGPPACRRSSARG
jgi:hypothetical protein